MAVADFNYDTSSHVYYIWNNIGDNGYKSSYYYYFPSSAPTSTMGFNDNVRFGFRIKLGSIGSGSVYKEVTRAGYVGLTSSTSGGGTMSTNSGWQLTTYVTWMPNLNYAPDSTFRRSYIDFPINGKSLSSGQTVKLLIYGEENKSFSSPSGYVYKHGTYCYMCKASYDGAGASASNINGLVKDGNTWNVWHHNNCYAFARVGSTNYDLTGSFRYYTDQGSTYHSGYYSGTPGRRVYHSGYTSYWTRYNLVRNGNLDYSSSTDVNFFAYVNGSSYGDVTYIYR